MFSGGGGWKKLKDDGTLETSSTFGGFSIGGGSKKLGAEDAST